MLLQESGVVYLVRLSNDQRVRVHVFVVHDVPEVGSTAQLSMSRSSATQMHAMQPCHFSINVTSNRQIT